jgi:uncharacterized protein DUF4397
MNLPIGERRVMLRHAWWVVSSCLVAGAGVACNEDVTGTQGGQGPFAGLRYVNVVPDTGALDIRVVDIVDAATFGATFRTGGSPTGAAAQTSPPYQSVEAGTRSIRVFNSSSDQAIAKQVLLETTFTFEANRNYTFALHGFARAGQTPALQAAIVADDAPPPIPSGQIAVRVWHLAPTLDPAATTPLDAWIVARGRAALAGSPTIAGQSYAATTRSAYVNVPTGPYRVAFTAAGTIEPILFQMTLPAGGAGVAGTTVAGTAITVLVVPRSVPGSRAPRPFTGIQAISSLTSNPDTTATAVTVAPHNLTTGTSVILNGADTAVYNGTFTVTVVDPTTFTYRMVRRAGGPAIGNPFWLPATAGSAFNGLAVSRLTFDTAATLVTLAPHGLRPRDIVTISGVDEPQYNGSFAVDSVNPTTVRYTPNGTPGASAATGAPVWRRGGDDFTRPNVMFLIDR